MQTRLASSIPAFQYARLGLTPAALAPAVVELPHLSFRVPAGFPSPADDYLDDGCDLNQLLVRNAAATYFYTLSGDSMDRANLPDGCKLLVDRSAEAKEGDIIVAYIPGDGHTCKRLTYELGRPVLVPESSNPCHKPRPIADGEELWILGVVTASIVQFRRR